MKNRTISIDDELNLYKAHIESLPEPDIDWQEVFDKKHPKFYYKSVLVLKILLILLCSYLLGWFALNIPKTIEDTTCMICNIALIIILLIYDVWYVVYLIKLIRLNVYRYSTVRFYDRLQKIEYYEKLEWIISFFIIFPIVIILSGKVIPYVFEYDYDIKEDIINIIVSIIIGIIYYTYNKKVFNKIKKN